MSFFFGGKGQKVKPQYTGLQTQTSASILPVVWAWGLSRFAPNIIWQGDFKATKVKQKAGKGGGGSIESYTYSGSYLLALCWGPINTVLRAWKDQEKHSTYTKLGMTLFTGIDPQAPWGYMTSNHPSEALGYSGVSYLAIANYDLGNSNALGQHSFEVAALRYNSQVNGAGDADPALIIQDLLTDPLRGVITGSLDFLDTNSLLSGPDATTTGDNAFQTYCRAMGFGLSPALSSQETGTSLLDRWAQVCNAAVVWTGYSLKFVPYGSETVTANGVTYLPETTIRYSFTDDDYIYEDEDPIKFDRIDPADAYNSITLQIRDRDNEYNSVPATWRDQALIDQFGLRQKDPQDAEEVCVKEMGTVMAALIGQREAYLNNTYVFKVGPEYCLLEPMDLVECYDPRWGTFPIQIEDIAEDDEDNLTLTGREYAGSVSSAGPSMNQPTTNTPINAGVDASPVNPPVIFQPPPSLTGGLPQIWAAVSGGDGIDDDPYWGGAEVWISTDGGTSYNVVGVINAPARMGVLKADLAPYVGANPDTVEVLEADASMSDAEFTTATAADAAAAVTLTYIAPEGLNEEEFLSYQTATLVAVDEYNLTNLYRGLYGSGPGAHATGAKFARLDEEAIFKYDFPISMIGQTIHVKFRSFNIWNSGYEDLSAAVAYPVTLQSGYVYGVGINGLNDVDLSGLADGDTLVWDSATQTWVPGAGGGGGGASVTISTTAPATPTAGDLWWNSEEGRLKIYYADADSSQWVDSMPVSGGGGGGSPGFGAHEYWRVYIDDNNGDGSFTVMVGSEFRDSGGVDLIGGGTALGSSNAGAGFLPDEAFLNWDGTNNYWSTASGSALPSWYGYQFATAVEVVSFTMTGVRDAARMPRAFKMQYSDDGTTWTDTTSFIGQTGWVIDGTDTREFTL